MIENCAELVFATPLWHLNGDLPDGMVEWGLEWMQRNPTNVSKSNSGGYQGDGNTNFDEIKGFEEYLHKRLEFLPAYWYQNWWINVNHKGDFNWGHTHPGADLSGIWYITDNKKTLKFEHPCFHNRLEPLARMMGHEYDQWDCIHKDCKAGDIIVFPSDIVHWVEPWTEDWPRVSITFNLKLKD